jgi:hypothetical protein
LGSIFNLKPNQKQKLSRCKKEEREEGREGTKKKGGKEKGEKK